MHIETEPTLVTENICRRLRLKRSLSLTSWQEAHHRVTVVPSRRVLNKFSGHISDDTEHYGPWQKFGIPYLVELLRRQRKQRLRIAVLELRDHPFVKTKFRLRILPGAGVVGHASTRDDRNSFVSCSQDFRNRSP